METNAGNWQVIWSSIIVPAGLGLWAIVQWMMGRRDRTEDRDLSTRDKLERRLREEREALSQTQKGLFEQLDRLLERETARANLLDEENDKLRRELWQGEREFDLVCGLAAEARQIVQSMQHLRGEEVTQFLPLPSRTFPTPLEPKTPSEGKKK
jgi:hypothetical protein